MLEQSEALERALWSCMRMLKEKAALSRQMAHRYREMGQMQSAAYVEENRRVDEQNIAVIEQLISAAVGSNTAIVEVGTETDASADDSEEKAPLRAGG